MFYSKKPCTKTLQELNISNNGFGDNDLYMLKLGLLANNSVVVVERVEEEVKDIHSLNSAPPSPSGESGFCANILLVEKGRMFWNNCVNPCVCLGAWSCREFVAK